MRKRLRANLDAAAVHVWKREVGDLSTRNFALHLGASQDLVLRLDIYKKLEKHNGCVNTVSFSENGDILVSGSDDKRIILWDWQRGDVKLKFHSGHENNVFQAKIMPFTNDRVIVTSAADGQVRRACITDRGRVETKLLAEHQGRAHKLAVEPGSPHIFYSCGEDGIVHHFDLRTPAGTKLFTCHSIDGGSSFRHVVHLNAITIDPRNPNFFAVGGFDEYARLYDIRKYKWDSSTEFDHPTNYFCPSHLIGDSQVGITGLAFSDQNELLISYNDEFIYLFSNEMALEHDFIPPLLDSDGEDGSDHKPVSSENVNDVVKPGPLVYKGHMNARTVKGVSFCGPRCEYVVSGSDCGRIFIWNKKDGNLLRVMEGDEQIVNCVESHPYNAVLASSGIDNDVKIWTPKSSVKATLPKNIGKEGYPPAHMIYFSLDDDELFNNGESFGYDEDDSDVDDDDVDNDVFDGNDDDVDNDVDNDVFDDNDDDVDNDVFDGNDDDVDNDVFDGNGRDDDNTCDDNDGSLEDQEDFDDDVNEQR